MKPTRISGFIKLLTTGFFLGVIYLIGRLIMTIKKKIAATFFMVFLFF
jgi:hypothetical protein